MAANVLKETKLSTTLRRMSPPSSPSRVRVLSTSQLPAKPRSEILATLDAEIPNWLSGPSAPSRDAEHRLGRKAAPPLTDPKPIHPFFTSSQESTNSVESQPRKRSKTAPSTTAPKKAARMKKPTPRIKSDVENSPEAAIEVETEEATDHTLPLPAYSYKDYSPTPAVVYTADEDEANDLVQCLKGPILGFDLEWVVKFRRNKPMLSNRTALVQICDEQMVLLVHVSAMKRFPAQVKALIENKDIAKLGANIKNDGQKLFRDYGILARNLVELGGLARQVEPSSHNRSIVSLAKVVEKYLGKALAKGPVRTSDWEKTPLTEAQKFYAANDAHCALMVYNTLSKMAVEGGKTLQPELIGADLAREYKDKVIANAITKGRAAAEANFSTAAPSSSPPLNVPPSSTSTSAPALPGPSVPYQSVVYAQGPPSSLETSLPSAPPSSNRTVAPLPQEPPRPQHIRAYNLWHHRNMSLPDICAALRSKDNPLAASTVISYVIGALQANPALPFSMVRLKALVQLDLGSWTRHRDWLLEKDGYTL